MELEKAPQFDSGFNLARFEGLALSVTCYAQLNASHTLVNMFLKLLLSNLNSINSVTSRPL